MLPGDFKIKKSKLRGVTSMGMCCSKRELGMGTDHEGIWVLPEDAQIGQPIADFMGLTDTVLDLEITPNRPDSLSVVGFAREVGAMYAKPWTNPLQDMAAKLELAGEVEPNAVKIDIADAVRCPALFRSRDSWREGGPEPRLDGRAPCRHWPALREQRRRRDELHSVPGSASRCMRLT